MKCIHPIIVNRVMKEFLEAASDLTYDNLTIDTEKWYQHLMSEISDEEYKENCNEEIIITKVSFRIKNGKNFATLTGGLDFAEEERIVMIDRKAILNYTRENLMNYGVLGNFRQRCPIAKGFADITLILLHELGHQETNNKVNFAKRTKEYIKGEELKKQLREYLNKGLITAEEYNYIINRYHVKKECEMLATNWAIEWLRDPEHRKLAKQFEKEFFACYEK